MAAPRASPRRRSAATNVNGCTTSPVAFLEGLYVLPEYRRRGVARRLCAAVEAWATALGCAELASDTWLDSIDSQRMHAALHFAETERVVYFSKPLSRIERSKRLEQMTS